MVEHGRNPFKVDDNGDDYQFSAKPKNVYKLLGLVNEYKIVNYELLPNLKKKNIIYIFLNTSSN